MSTRKISDVGLMAAIAAMVVPPNHRFVPDALPTFSLKRNQRQWNEAGAAPHQGARECARRLRQLQRSGH